MKLENLAIIFVIIIIPITIVLSEYIDRKIEAEKLELIYNKRLLTSTQDAINAYQINTVSNQFGDVTNSKIQDIIGATNSFYNSLAANFNYIGSKAGIMKEYVPALVFTLYDGYYIYSPFKNTLTEVTNNAPDYSEDTEIMEGLKPYVYYTCRYHIDDSNDFIITYTLDNYITITGKIKGDYVYDYGYLYSIGETNGIQKTTDGYKYDGIEFTATDIEQMKEFVGDIEYSYVKVNGKKYYLDNDYYKERALNSNDEATYKGITFKARAGIFFIDSNGEKNYSQTNGYSTSNTDAQNDVFLQYYKAITKNKSAYEYYKNAYEFSKAALGTPVSNYKDKAGNDVNSLGYGLSSLKCRDSEFYKNSSTGVTDFKEYGDYDIFLEDPQFQSSNFNNHRKAVIRYVVETNLSAAISGYSSKSVGTFIMPKISETDWDLIQNDSCAISFMQGMKIGDKTYNGYSVVSNAYTKEHIDENDIYILKVDNTYCRVTDSTLTNNIKSKTSLGYYPGIWKLNFEQRKDMNSKYYNPMSYMNGSTPIAYLGSYTSISGVTGINSLKDYENDMYKYVSGTNVDLKKAYYMALGRERWGAFNVNNINYELYGSNGNEYFLKDY